MLNVALPKGRLGEQAFNILERAGYTCPSLRDKGRRLIFEDPESGVRYFWVKPSDVAIYVERQAADVGIVGKDILAEYSPDVYELADLHIGVCKMAVAAPKAFRDDTRRTLCVATKFPNIASEYYRRMGRDIDIIGLHGSIEIAPLLGLSDVIVDIVETGGTLRANGLTVFDDVMPVSARLIACKASYRFSHDEVTDMCAKIKKIVAEDTDDQDK